MLFGNMNELIQAGSDLEELNLQSENQSFGTMAQRSARSSLV
jgi:hypothetical protein